MPAGRPFAFTTNELKQKYSEYKEYMKTQFDYKYDVIKSGDRAGEQIEIKIPKVKSVETFCLFIGVTAKTFYNWLNAESENIDSELLHFITYMHEELKEERKSAGLNGAIDSRLLAKIDGYRDTVDINQQISVNALPVHIGNNIIDLTDSEFEVVNNNNTDMLTELI